MITPQAHHFAERVDQGPGPDRPAPSGSTVWWTVKAVAVVAAVVLSCVGFAGVLEASSAHCYEVSKRVCFSRVIDHLTGETAPRTAD
ncbi:hypothetical protein [Paractinoplanes maris]|uniref:hypothetical protein n=1 Tax=Paractinoplanes maris TaxID=1734446 RepID=UPI0020206A50|nr:hypothetical protein [Actinoplanes maris]